MYVSDLFNVSLLCIKIILSLVVLHTIYNTCLIDMSIMCMSLSVPFSAFRYKYASLSYQLSYQSFEINKALFLKKKHTVQKLTNLPNNRKRNINKYIKERYESNIPRSMVCDSFTYHNLTYI